MIYTITFNSPGTMPSRVTGLDFNITTGFDAITPGAVYGNIGTQTFIIDQDSSKISFFDNFQNGSVFFQDPKLAMYITNSFGLPVNIDITSIVAYNRNGNSVPLTGYPPTIQIPYPTTPGQTAMDSIVLSNGNSNIQAGMAINPNLIVYTLTANTAPSSSTGFVLDTSSFKATVRIDLPLRGYADQFTVQDTAEFQLDRIEDVESATFRLNIRNGFPGRAVNQVYFADANFNILDSIFTLQQDREIAAAQVNSSGIVTTPSDTRIDIPFSGSRLEHLYNCRKILINSTIETTDAPNRIVEIYDYYNINVKIGVRTKLKLGL
jgi:hypothetical protein